MNIQLYLYMNTDTEISYETSAIEINKSPC